MPNLRGRPTRLTAEERKSLTHGDFWIPQEEREVYRRALEAINAANLRVAHARLESGTTIGKLALAGW